MEINRVLEELPLQGSFIQDIRQTDYQNTYINFYKPGRNLWLLVSLTQGKTRIHEVSKKPAFLKKPPRFVEYLRSHIMGGKVLKAEQWGRERILELEIGTAEGTFTLWIRLWGEDSNILVTGEDRIILEAAFRRPGSLEIKGHPFLPPQIPDYTQGERKVFTLRDLPGEESYNKKLEEYYKGAGQDEDLERLRAQLIRRLKASFEVLDDNLRQRLFRREEYRRKDDWKTYGDLISAFAHEITLGEKSWTGEDFRDFSQVVIPLDPTLSALENSQKYYKLYAKARDGEVRLEEDIAHALGEKNQLESKLEQAAWEEDIHWIKKELKALAPLPQSKEKNPIPGLEFASGAYRILVGRTAKENDELLRRHVRGGDLWLHTRDVPGGYVFIKVPKGKTVPLEPLLDAAQLALHYSKAKQDGQADLYYTQVKHLRRAKDGPLGLVLPTQEKNLHIRIDQEKIERLQRSRRGNE